MNRKKLLFIISSCLLLCCIAIGILSYGNIPKNEEVTPVLEENITSAERQQTGNGFYYAGGTEIVYIDDEGAHTVMCNLENELGGERISYLRAIEGTDALIAFGDNMVGYVLKEVEDGLQMVGSFSYDGVPMAVTNDDKEFYVLYKVGKYHEVIVYDVKEPSAGAVRRGLLYNYDGMKKEGVSFTLAQGLRIREATLVDGKLYVIHDGGVYKIDSSLKMNCFKFISEEERAAMGIVTYNKNSYDFVISEKAYDKEMLVTYTTGVTGGFYRSQDNRLYFMASDRMLKYCTLEEIGQGDLGTDLKMHETAFGILQENVNAKPVLSFDKQNDKAYLSFDTTNDLVCLNMETGEKEFSVQSEFGVSTKIVNTSGDTMLLLHTDTNSGSSEKLFMKVLDLEKQAHKDAATVLLTVSIVASVILLIVTILLAIRAFAAKGNARLVRTLKEMRKHKWIYIILIPSLVGLFMFCYYPGIASMWLSFFDYTSDKQTMKWNNFANYISIFTNKYSLEAFRNMIIFVFTDLLTAILPPLVFAFLLSFMRSKRYSNITRTLLFIPGIIPGIATLLIWRTGIYGEYGVINTVIKMLEGEPVKFLTSSGNALMSIVMMGFPFVGTFVTPTDSGATYNKVIVEKTISLQETTYDFVKSGNYINVQYSGISDYSSGLNFLTPEFATSYMSFSGGLTYEALATGAPSFYMATNHDLQFAWGSTSGFANGASFTILKGAQIPYTSTSGTAYATLDANYTFTFAPPTDANLYLNSVTVKKVDSLEEEETEKISLVNKKYNYEVEGKYINIDYTGISDFGSSLGENFFDEEFSNNYVTYEGGLTYETLATGLTRFCVATNSVLQLLYEGRTEAFAIGASFTIKEGAPIPYRNTNGDAVTIPLDADYTFVFAASTSGGSVYNDVQVIKSTTFSINVNNHLTSGANTDVMTDIIIPESNVTGYDATYTYIQDDTTYADYIDIAGIPYTKLSGMDVKLQFILVDGYRCLRIANWGELRNTLQVGDYMLFKKGMPLYYTTDGSSRYMKATLDSDYIYMVTDTTTEHNQYFKGMVYDSEHHKWALPDTFSDSTGTQEADQIFNVTFTTDDSCLHTGYAVDLFENSMAKDYIDFAGHSLADAAAMSNAILISTTDGTNVLQFQFNATAVKKLKVGDMIVLKKGLPLIYTTYDTNAVDTAILDDEYTLVVTDKYDDNGTTRLKFNCTLSGTYGLQAGELLREEGATEKYVNVLYSEGCF